MRKAGLLVTRDMVAIFTMSIEQIEIQGQKLDASAAQYETEDEQGSRFNLMLCLVALSPPSQKAVDQTPHQDLEFI